MGALSVSYVRHDSGAPVHCEVDLLWREDPLVYRVWQDQDLASLAEGTVLDHFQVTRGAGGLHATSPGMVAVEHLGRVRVAVNRWLSDVERYVRVVQVR